MFTTAILDTSLSSQSFLGWIVESFMREPRKHRPRGEIFGPMHPSIHENVVYLKALTDTHVSSGSTLALFMSNANSSALPWNLQMIGLHASCDKDFQNSTAKTI